MANEDALRIQTVLPVHAQNAGLFISKGRWIHSERVIDSHELIFVRQGTLSMHEEGREFVLEPGQTLLLWPGRRHGGTALNPEDLQFYWIHFEVEGGKGRRLDSIIRVPRTATISRPDRLTELFRRFLDDQEAKCLDQASADLLVMLMLCQVARSHNSAEDAVGTIAVLAQRAEAYIRTHFDQAISTSTIARTLDCNPDYLGRAFRAVYGTTPTAFLHRLRLQNARTLLMEGAMSVGQIARSCGFNDAGYFRRVFHRHEGMSPLAYRRLYARVHINIR